MGALGSRQIRISKEIAMCRAMLAALALLALLPAAAFAQTGERCFPETGQCIGGRIRLYWEANGGLAVFGYPITAVAAETVEGVPLQVQWFERDRLEIQPNDVITAGRLGAQRLEQLGRPFTPGPGGAAPAGCTMFPETGYAACGDILAYWRANGGLARFGYPLTGEIQETLEGQVYTVQWFERRRIERHPELPGAPLLLGLLGREVRDAINGAPIALPPEPGPQPTIAPAPAPQLPPPSYNNCQADPNPGAAPNAPIKIVTVNKGDETVTLQNVSGAAISLDGWRMCSIRGNQQHPISGPLAPGESKTFSGPAASIWSNNDRDDGALYNPEGQLVSYWTDPDLN
jgi:hypothetical protein